MSGLTDARHGVWLKAARLSRLDPDYPTLAQLEGREIAVCKIEGEVFALHNICSHAFARMSDGYIEGFQLFCPLHQGSFDIRTGEAVAAPCHEPIETYPVKVENDEVFVQVPHQQGIK